MAVSAALPPLVPRRRFLASARRNSRSSSRMFSIPRNTYRKPACRLSGARGRPWLAMAEVIACTVNSRSSSPASMIATESLESSHVQGDVVVDEEDRPGAVRARVANIGDDAVEVVGVEIAPAHLDDRAE